MTSEYPVTVKRSKRKTASIYIERDGSISLLVPDNLNDEQVDGILKRYEYRIHKYQAKRQLLNQKAIKREPVNGESFLYLGRNYYLQYSGEVRGIEFKGRYFLSPQVEANQLKKLFKEFYRERGQVFIAPRVAKYSAIMGVNAEETAILELKNRWASCSGKKPKVNFHWRVMMAPVSVLEYIIVHELAHLKHKRHNTSFWNEVDRVMPDYRKQVAWLREHGASLSL